MKRVIKMAILIILFLSGIVTLFVSINACENGRITNNQCAFNSLFGVFMMGVSILSGYTFDLEDEVKYLERENEMLQTKNIALLNRLPKVEKTEEKPLCYKPVIHTPIEPSKFNRCNVSKCKHNDNGYCINTKAIFTDGICQSMEEN